MPHLAPIVSGLTLSSGRVTRRRLGARHHTLMQTKPQYAASCQQCRFRAGISTTFSLLRAPVQNYTTPKRGLNSRSSPTAFSRVGSARRRRGPIRLCRALPVDRIPRLQLASPRSVTSPAPPSLSARSALSGAHRSGPLRRRSANSASRQLGSPSRHRQSRTNKQSDRPAGGAHASGARDETVSPDATRYGLLLIALMVVLFWSARTLFHRGGVRTTIAGIAAMGLVVAPMAIAQHASAPRLFYWTWRGLSSNSLPYTPFINRNDFAGWLVMAIPPRSATR